MRALVFWTFAGMGSEGNRLEVQTVAQLPDLRSLPLAQLLQTAAWRHAHPPARAAKQLIFSGSPHSAFSNRPWTFGDHLALALIPAFSAFSMSKETSFEQHLGGSPSAPLLTYHELQEASGSDQYTVSCAAFEKHLEVVRRFASGSQNGLCRTFISFDDGHRSNVELALPRLNHHGLKAIFFVTSGWTSKKESALGWRDLAKLVSSGHSVQSHGMSHAFFTHCSDVELAREIKGSKELLEERLGIVVDSISMPGGRWDERVLRACAAAGYRHVYTSDPVRRPRLCHGVWLHGRIMVRNHTGVEHIEKFLSGDPRFWLALRARHRAQSFMRKLLGDSFYHALWRKMARRAEPAMGQSNLALAPEPQQVDELMPAGEKD